MKTPNEKTAERLLQEAWEAMDASTDATSTAERTRLRRDAARLQREAQEHLTAAKQERAA